MQSFRANPIYANYARDYRPTAASSNLFPSSSLTSGSWSSNINTNTNQLPTRPTSDNNKKTQPYGTKYEVLVIDLPNYVDSATMQIVLSRQRFKSINTKVDSLNLDGSIRYHGIIEFDTEKKARDWIEYNEGYLKFSDGVISKMEYMNDKDESSMWNTNQTLNNGNKNGQSTSWTCAKCSVNNKSARYECFKCGTSINESRNLEDKGDTLVGTVSCDTLLIRDLPKNVTEMDIRSMLNQYTGYQIKKIQIAQSKRYALVQMNDSNEANYLLNVFNRLAPYINNSRVIVTFSKQPIHIFVFQDDINTMRNYNKPTDQQCALSAGIQETVHTPFGVRKVFAKPDTKEFQLESTSGYLYDRGTGFYYDPKTDFYYDPQTQQWNFYCKRYSTFIPCEGGNEVLKKRLMDEEDEHEKNYPPLNKISNPPRKTEKHDELIPAPRKKYTRMTSPGQTQEKTIQIRRSVENHESKPLGSEIFYARQRIVSPVRHAEDYDMRKISRETIPKHHDRRALSPPPKILRYETPLPVQKSEEAVSLAMEMMRSCLDQNRFIIQTFGSKLSTEDRCALNELETQMSGVRGAHDPLKEAQRTMKDSQRATKAILEKYELRERLKKEKEKTAVWNILPPSMIRREETWSRRSRSPSRNRDTWKSSGASPSFLGSSPHKMDNWRSDSRTSSPGTVRSGRWSSGTEVRPDIWNEEKSMLVKKTIIRGERLPSLEHPIQGSSSPPRSNLVMKEVIKHEGTAPYRQQELSLRDTWKSRESTKYSNQTLGPADWRSSKRTPLLSKPDVVPAVWCSNSAAISTLQDNMAKKQQELLAEQHKAILVQQQEKLSQQFARAMTPYVLVPNSLLQQLIQQGPIAGPLVRAPNGGPLLQTPSALTVGRIGGPSNQLHYGLFPKEYASNSKDWEIALSQGKQTSAPIRIEKPLHQRECLAAVRPIRSLPGTKATVVREGFKVNKQPERVQKESKPWIPQDDSDLVTDEIRQYMDDILETVEDEVDQ